MGFNSHPIIAYQSGLTLDQARIIAPLLFLLLLCFAIPGMLGDRRRKALERKFGRGWYTDKRIRQLGYELILGGLGGIAKKLPRKKTGKKVSDYRSRDWTVNDILRRLNVPQVPSEKDAYLFRISSEKYAGETQAITWMTHMSEDDSAVDLFIEAMQAFDDRKKS